MKPGRLLRWYPRAWRERYGDEMLALIQDTLDEGRPMWRLRLSVVRGGLRERGHQTRQAATAVIPPDWPLRWGSMAVTGLIVATLPAIVTQGPAPARGWQMAAALDTLLAIVALTGAMVLAGGLVALPALVRFLRAGGWPTIRHRARWAAGATAVAGGGLVGLILVLGPHPAAQADGSLAYSAGVGATALAMAIAVGLWAATATATARRLPRAPRVRAIHLILGALTPIAVTAMSIASGFWWWAAQSSDVVLVLALGNLGLASLGAPKVIGRAVRSGRRLWATTGPGNHH